MIPLELSTIVQQTKKFNDILIHYILYSSISLFVGMFGFVEAVAKRGLWAYVPRVQMTRRPSGQDIRHDWD